ncbi:hypothetical protein [Shewanella maritima]|uniref:hypothetical protein n=1 Tax=Shewanella maritima TaxID=2520507 RepID=UPI0037370544
MGIINQNIHNGVLTIAVGTCYHFNLISASGVVKVELQNNGKTVLDTDFWVGMSLPNPTQFDKIIIQGDSAPIEFWADEVAMSQAGNINVAAAKALRTSVVYVQGQKQLTGNDLVRQQVEVRSDKDILLTGAAFNDGWLLKAGDEKKLPLAGILNGYFPYPKIDLSATTLNQEISEMWSTGTGLFLNNLYVSDDKTVYLAGHSQSLMANFDGAGWVKHQQFAHANDEYVLFPSADGVIYMSKRDNNLMSIWKSTDDGRNFSVVTTTFDISVLAGSDVNFSVHAHQHYFINDVISQVFSDVDINFNIKTERVTVNKHADPSYKMLAKLSDANWLMVEHHGYSYSGGKLYRSTDGGVSWVADDYYTDLSPDMLMTDKTGQYVVIKQSSGHLAFSADYGASFIECLAKSFYLSANPCFVSGGVWVLPYEGKFYGFQVRETDVLMLESVDLPLSVNRNIQSYMNKIGEVFTRDGLVGAEIQLSVDGDLSPAKVEVMEYLG